jgi:hypothetical protein
MTEVLALSTPARKRDLTLLKERIASGDAAAVPEFLRSADDATVESFLDPQLTERALTALGAHLRAILRHLQDPARVHLPSSSVLTLVQTGMEDPDTFSDYRTHVVMAAIAIHRFSSDSKIASVFKFLDFRLLRNDQLRALGGLALNPDAVGPPTNARILRAQAGRKSESGSVRVVRGVDRGCADIISVYSEFLAIDSSPGCEIEGLSGPLINRGREKLSPSDRELGERQSITIEFQRELFVAPKSYSLRSSAMRGWELQGLVLSQWKILDRCEETSVLSDGEWHEFAISGFASPLIRGICLKQTNSSASRMVVCGFRLCSDVVAPSAVLDSVRARVGTVKAGNTVDSGQLTGNDQESRDEAMTDPAESDRDGGQCQCQRSPNLVIVDEKALMSVAVRAAALNRPVITNLAEIEEVRTLSLSRFGSVHLVRREIEGRFEYFAAKYYNAGDNRDGLQAFHDRVRGLISLSHPSVMPIAGLIAPTKTAGPIVLTPYSEIGSVADVLDRVRRNDPPSFWNETGKLRMIVSLISGFAYLHNQGVVHREVKPSDLIVQPNGSIVICGYLTSVFEEHRFTRASQLGSPSYMAPEIYEDRQNGRKSRDPKTDVFSFALILYETLCGQRVFPPTCSASVIMRRAMSAKASDRPVIPSDWHPLLRELIMKGWGYAPAKRPSFEVMWKQLLDAKFAVFPNVEVHFVPG